MLWHVHALSSQGTHNHPPSLSTALVSGHQLPPPPSEGQGLSKSHTVLLEGSFLLSCRSRAPPDAAPSPQSLQHRLQQWAQHLLLHQFPPSTAPAPLPGAVAGRKPSLGINKNRASIEETLVPPAVPAPALHGSTTSPGSTPGEGGQASRALLSCESPSEHHTHHLQGCLSWSPAAAWSC